MLARLIPICVVALVLVGCGPAKLDVSKTYTLGGDTTAQAIELDPQAKPQTINVEFSTTGDEVEVAVFKKADAKTIDDVAMADSKKALASKKGKSDSFSVDIPENTGAWVAVRALSGKKQDVQIKVTNRK